MTIWKFILSVTDVQLVRMPRGSEILSLQVQDGVPCVWAKCDPHVGIEERVIYTHGTGHQVNPLCGKFLGTYQLSGGSLIFHVFEAAK